MLDPDLQARIERRLEDGEHLVWYAKPRPSAWFPKWPVVVSAGIFWCCLLAWTLWSVLSPSTVPVEGRTVIVFKVITDATPFVDRLARSTFLLPFFAIGIGMILSPLWHWFWSVRVIYAVTDRRALYVGGRFSTRSIRAADFLAPRCVNHHNGLSDLFFFLETATVNRFTNAPTSTYLEGFRNLPATEAPAAETALRALYAQAHRRETRLTFTERQRLEEIADATNTKGGHYAFAPKSVPVMNTCGKQTKPMTQDDIEVDVGDL